MDALSALSAAGNIIQFIQFGTQILSKGREIYHSTNGLPGEQAELEAVSQGVKSVSQSVKQSAINNLKIIINVESINEGVDIVSAIQELHGHTQKLRLSRDGRQSLCVNNYDRALNSICDGCIDIANELSDCLEKLKVNGQKHRRWKSFRQAMKTIWKRDDIENLVRRLLLFRGQLELHILGSLRTEQTRSSIEEDTRFQALQDRTQKIITYVLESRYVFEDDLMYRADKLEKASASQHDMTRSTVTKSVQDAMFRILEEYKSRSSLFEALLKLKENIRTVEEINHDVENLILKALKFPMMVKRHDEIPEPHPQTFHWVLEKGQHSNMPWSNLSEWLRCGTGVYWVNGKAASGKSTLMRHIFDSPQTREPLTEWTQGQSLQTAGFFFWNSGTPEQRSHEGILRSLLHQGLSAQRDLIHLVLPKQSESLYSQCTEYSKAQALLNSEPEITWTLPNLQDGFRRLTNELVNTKMCLFIDGLDEYEVEYDGDYEEMARFLTEVTRNRSVKVCLSSRPWLVFEDAFKGFPSLRLQDLTYADIVQYVDQRLDSNARWVHLEQNEAKNAAALKKELVDMASGIFLWVKLVVSSLLSGLSNRDEISDLFKRLRLLPRGLEKLYDHMLRTIDPPFYLEEASKIFQILRTARNAQEQVTIEVQGSTTTLSLLTLLLADERNSASVFETFELTAEETQKQCQRMADRLKTRCVGFLELGGAADEGVSHQYVLYMHRTVRDFLESPEVWSKLLGHTSKSEFHPAISLLQSSILNIKTRLNSGGIWEYVSGEFWRRVQLAMKYGCMADGQPGNLLERLLDELDLTVSKHQRECDHHSIFHWSTEKNLQGEKVDYESESTFVSFAIEYGLSSYVRAKLYRDPSVIGRKRGRPLLDYAVCPNKVISNIPHRPQIVDLLLNYGGSPNEEFNGTTPWTNVLYHLGSYHFQSEGSKKETTLRLEDWVEIIAMLVTHNAEPTVSLLFDSGCQLVHIRSAVDIIRYAFGQQYPKQAAEITQILIARGAKATATIDSVGEKNSKAEKPSNNLQEHSIAGSVRRRKSSNGLANRQFPSTTGYPTEPQSRPAKQELQCLVSPARRELQRVIGKSEPRRGLWPFE